MAISKTITLTEFLDRNASRIVAHGWRAEHEITTMLRTKETIEPDGAMYRTEANASGDVLTVMVGTIPEHGLHLSISCQKRTKNGLAPSRYPTWDEIRDARYLFLPDAVEMVMHLPPRAQYVNVHSSCFHLHELKEPTT